VSVCVGGVSEREREKEERERERECVCECVCERESAETVYAALPEGSAFSMRL